MAPCALAHNNAILHSNHLSTKIHALIAFYNYHRRCYSNRKKTTTTRSLTLIYEIASINDRSKIAIR